MAARALALVLGVLVVGVLVVGVLVGSGLAGLAHFPPNDACSDFGSLGEGAVYLEWWPSGQRCEYDVSGRFVRSTHFGSTLTELYAWIVVATLLAAAAVFKRRSAFVRGAAATAAPLAVTGAVWTLAGAQLTFGTALLVGLPLAFALDHLLRPASTRSARASLWVAVVVATLAFFAPFAVIVVPWFAIAVVVLAGALASTGVARSRRSSTA